VAEACVFGALPGLEPSQPGQSGRQVGSLPGLSSEGHDLMKSGLRFDPLVGGGPTDSQIAEEVEQHP
jgi:hypothetical protein